MIVYDVSDLERSAYKRRQAYQQAARTLLYVPTRAIRCTCGDLVLAELGRWTNCLSCRCSHWVS